MWIITLENQPSSLRGGKEISMFDVCRRLAQRGHQVSLLYSKEGNLLEAYQKFCYQTIKVSDWSVYPNQPLSLVRFLGNVLKTAYHLGWGKSNAFVYVDDYRFCLFSHVLARILNLPSVFHIRYRTPKVFHRQHRLGLQGIQQCMAVSNFTANQWMNLGLIKKNKIETVYNGIDPDIFQPTNALSQIRHDWQLSPEERVISYLGRLDKAKGIETLIRAFAVLSANCEHKLKLLIAGNPVCHRNVAEGETYLQFLKQLSKELGVEESIQFLGHVTDTPSLYQCSDITVLPSEYPEPFGRIIIESMACGVPVVASQTGGIPEILTGEFQRGLFTPGDEQELGVKLQALLNWRSNDPDLSDRCRQHILANFTLERTVDGIEQVFLKSLTNF